VVSSRRAIVLVLAEKAEPVDSAAEVVHAETISLAVPIVVRLTRYVRVPYPAQVPLSRRAVFTRDGQTCVYCGGSATSIDHVVPRSRVGRTPGTTSWPPAGGATTPRPTARWRRWAGRCRTPHARPAAPRGVCWAPAPSTRAGVSGSASPRA
jgi:5-methylcytosine-specific restriction endonuclease McrA